MKPKLLRIIKCPICGYEYLPAEIFMPSAFLGKPKNIIRDGNGKIVSYEGIKMDDTETYRCDKCDSFFEVISTTNFVSRPVGENTPYHITKLNIQKFKLEE